MVDKKKKVPAARQSWSVLGVGPAPVLAGEDEKAYDALLARITGSVCPQDEIEELWVYDIVYMTWEILRLRQYKAALIKAAVPEVLEEILEPVADRLLAAEEPPVQFKSAYLSGPHAALADAIASWKERKADALAWVDDMLGELELTKDDLYARAMVYAIGDIDSIDNLAWRAENTRDGLIQQIERRRADLAERLRRAARDAENAAAEEAELIPPKAA